VSDWLPRCRECKSQTVTLYANGVLVWDGFEWSSTGEFGKAWLNCSKCGHTWKTNRSASELASILRLS
jgi:hypothetical protein